MTTTCPHCNGKSPAIRKDGYTKFFIVPLSDKMKEASKQLERMKKIADTENDDTIGTTSRRPSEKTDATFGDDDEDEEDEGNIEGSEE